MEKKMEDEMEAAIYRALQGLYELYSKLPKGSYLGDYIGEYSRVY